MYIIYEELCADHTILHAGIHFIVTNSTYIINTRTYPYIHTCVRVCVSLLVSIISITNILHHCVSQRRPQRVLCWVEKKRSWNHIDHAREGPWPGATCWVQRTILCIVAMFHYRCSSPR